MVSIINGLLRTPKEFQFNQLRDYLNKDLSTAMARLPEVIWTSHSWVIIIGYVAFSRPMPLSRFALMAPARAVKFPKFPKFPKFLRLANHISRFPKSHRQDYCKVDMRCALCWNNKRCIIPLMSRFIPLCNP